jgi:hypothetical protein
LRARHFTFEKDAKNRRLLRLTVANNTLRLEAKGHLSGLLLNDAINVEKVTSIRVSWGIMQYPLDVSYENKVNNEALMIYFFFGTEKISSGHLLIPNSPYFIGLFLCQDEQVDYPYMGRYFQKSGRFVCLGKPKPNATVVSEFDLDAAFKRYFDKNRTPGISGSALALIPPKREGAAKPRRLSRALSLSGPTVLTLHNRLSAIRTRPSQSGRTADPRQRRATVSMPSHALLPRVPVRVSAEIGAADSS